MEQWILKLLPRNQIQLIAPDTQSWIGNYAYPLDFTWEGIDYVYLSSYFCNPGVYKKTDKILEFVDQTAN